MITHLFKCTITYIDIPNKIYNESSVKTIHLFGIKIFKRTYQRDEVVNSVKEKIGFK